MKIFDARETYLSKQVLPPGMRPQTLLVRDQHLIALTTEDSPRDAKAKGIGILELDLNEDSSMPWRHFQLPWPATERSLVAPRPIGLIDETLIIAAHRRAPSREQSILEFFIIAFNLRQGSWTGRSNDAKWHPISSGPLKIDPIQETTQLIAYIDGSYALQIHADNTRYDLDNWHRSAETEEHLKAQKNALRSHFQYAAAGFMVGPDFVCPDLGVTFTGFNGLAKPAKSSNADKAAGLGLIYLSCKESDKPTHALITTQILRAASPPAADQGGGSGVPRPQEVLESSFMKFMLP